MSSWNKPLLCFSVISDIHVQSGDVRSQDKFKAALADLYAVNPQADACVINGDLTNGMPADYAKLKEIVDAGPHSGQVFYTIGNHEFYKSWFDEQGEWNPGQFPNGEAESASVGRFLQFVGEENVYYEKRVGGYPFIFLGSEKYGQSDLNILEDAYLSPAQLQWLEQALKRGAAVRKPIFVFLHQPLPCSVSGTSFPGVNDRAVVQHEELRRMLGAYPQVILFSGHTHWELKLPGALGIKISPW